MLQGRVRHTWPKVTNTSPCELSSYQPISNLSFPTNTLQLVVGVQLTEYLSSAGLLPVHPSIGFIGVDLGGSRGARPPIIELGAKLSFCPPKIQVRIFENIETTSETKTKNLTTTRNTTMKTVISIIYTR